MFQIEDTMLNRNDLTDNIIVIHLFISS
jgi:hypothetical protein